MLLLKKLLTALIMPSTSLILLTLMGILISIRRPKLGRAIAFLGLALLTALSMPFVANELRQDLEHLPPISTASLEDAEAIVILAGGVYRNAPEYGGDTISSSSLMRSRYGVFLQKRTGLPILVSGGAPFGGKPEAEVMRDTIETEFHGRVRWIENQSRDTTENAQYSVALLKSAGISKIALVSHSTHLPRAVELFAREGITVFPAPTGLQVAPGSSILHFVPQSGALHSSTQTLHELLGRQVNRLR
jgi:uncharacterized SAM-binding protein YcdF (DUF218 family)